jgi:glycogen operon protein
MMSPPLVESLAQDPVLARTTLIAEAWDAGGLYQVGNFPAWNRWVEWNGKYRDCLRRFIKGDGDRAPELYIRIRGSNDMYSSRGPTASVNFVTCHDGFTLYDLVSYNEKHNEANGEDNRDGSNCNDSWNCGIEGETDDPAVNALRFRQIKNMLTILLTSRGIPMLLAGDEFGNTQWGNNNAYCQDNEVSWLDWNLLKKNQDLFRYVKGLIAFRKEHPILRDADYEFGHNGTGYPELSFHGTTPWSLDETAASLIFAYMFAEDHEYYGTRQDCFIYVAVNAHWEEHAFTLPIVPAQVRWRIAFDSSSSMDGQGSGLHFKENELHLGPRSTAILVAE